MEAWPKEKSTGFKKADRHKLQAVGKKVDTALNGVRKVIITDGNRRIFAVFMYR